MDGILEQIWKRRFVFFGTFFVVFTLSYIVLLALDFLPEPPAADTDTSTTKEMVETESVMAVVETTEESEDLVVEPAVEPVVSAVFPTKIHIAKLNKTVAVLNPASRTIADLDAALLDGVVRHPDSATLAQDGTVFILGHSSYLPNVFNKNFQAFNGIQNLEWGDTIEVYSDDAVYEYRVEKVYRARAQDVTVPIAGAEKTLTLATCNSFGSVDDRYIVEATQLSVNKL